MSGIGPSSLRNFLSGRINSPTLETLMALSKTLECSLAELVGIKETRVESMAATSVWRPDIFLNTTECKKYCRKQRYYPPK